MSCHRVAEPGILSLSPHPRSFRIARVHPGDRCEGATFGFAAPSPADSPEWPRHAHVYTDWHWHCCCKTQYASVVSDAHLVHCHLPLVALLEAAARLGITTEVRDETGYWATRDTATC